MTNKNNQNYKKIMNNPMKSEVSPSLSLNFTVSQVELLSLIKKKYQKKQFMQQVYSSPPMASKSCQFESSNWNQFDFPKLQNSSKITRSNTKLKEQTEILQNKKKDVKLKQKVRYYSRSVNTASFASALTASETRIFKSKMQTQQWILPHDLHLLIKVLQNMIIQLDKHESTLNTFGLDVRLLFFLELNSQKNKTESMSKINSKFLNQDSRKTDKISNENIKGTSTINNDTLEADEDEKKFDELSKDKLIKTLKCDISTRTISMSKITFDEFHLLLSYAWRLFVMILVKQLNPSKIKKPQNKILYPGLQTITTYTLSSELTNSSPTTTAYNKNESLSNNEDKLLKEILSDDKIEIKSNLLVRSSQSKTEVKNNRKKEHNGFLGLILKHFKFRDATTSMEECQEKSFANLSVWKQSALKSSDNKIFVSPPESAFSTISLPSVSATRTSSLPSNEARINSEADKKTTKLPPETFPYKYTTIEYLSKDVLKTTTYETTKQPKIVMGSTLRPLNDDDFIHSSYDEEPVLKELFDKPESTKEPVQASISGKSDYIYSAASAVTKEKLAEIEKKSGVFYEILSYVYDKIVSRNSSKNNIDIILPEKTSVATKISLESVKIIHDANSKISIPKNEEEKLEKTAKSTCNFLFSNNPSLNMTVPTTRDEIKITFTEPTQSQSKEKLDKTFKKTKKLEKTPTNKIKTKTSVHPKKYIKRHSKEQELKVIRNNSNLLLSSSNTESQENVCSLHSPSVASLISSNISLFSFKESADSPKALSAKKLIKTVEQMLPKYFLYNIDDDLSDDEHLKKLKVSVSQNTSISCVRPHPKHKWLNDLEEKGKCNFLNEETLRELLRFILKEIEIEKELRKQTRALKKQKNKKISLSTSTNSLLLKSRKSKSTQLSVNNLFVRPLSTFSTLSLELCERSASKLNYDSKGIFETQDKNSAKSVTFCPKCTFSKKEYVIHQPPKTNTSDVSKEIKNPQTKILLEKFIFNNVEDHNYFNTLWEDRYENNITKNYKLSKLKLSKFALIFNLLTVPKNRYDDCQKSSDLYILSETGSTNERFEHGSKPLKHLHNKKYYSSTSEYSENISLMPVSVHRAKGVLKKKDNYHQPKIIEQGGVTKSKRRLSNVFYDCDNRNKKKSFTEFKNSEEIVHCNYCEDQQFFLFKSRTNLPKTVLLPQTCKTHKHSKPSFSSCAIVTRSLAHNEFGHRSKNICERNVRNRRLSAKRTVGDVQIDALSSNQHQLEMNDLEPAVIQLPIVMLKDTSVHKNTTKTSNEPKSKHVTWNLQFHLPR